MVEEEVRQAALELLRKIEKRVVTEKLRPSFCGELSDHIQSQLHFILETQFQEERFGELGGYIVSSPNSLEFKIVENMLHKYVQSYENGDTSKEVMTEIYRSVYALKELHKTSGFSEKSFPMQMLSALSDLTEQQLTPDQEKNKDPEYRKKFACFYKRYVLDYFHVYDKEQFDPRYLMLFHVHQNGTEPSATDIITNTKGAVPHLVISAKPDYLQEGIKLYMIHSGASELLYQGPLQAKKGMCIA